MSAVASAGADLYWIPLGAGGHSVRLNGKIYEAIVASRRRQPRRDLYHSAIVVGIDGERWTIESGPSPTPDLASRGVVATGPVGTAALGHWRLFRYEVRCWRGGNIPDLGQAVGGPVRITSDPDAVQRLIDLAPQVPTPVWGRDELRAGDMWNSNSLIAWLIVRAGLAAEDLLPPPGGRAPGWSAGIVVARRDLENRRAPGACRGPCHSGGDRAARLAARPGGHATAGAPTSAATSSANASTASQSV